MQLYTLGCIAGNPRLNCTRKRVKPTCGTNNIWYKNTCTLRLHRCIYNIVTLQRDLSNKSCKYSTIIFCKVWLSVICRYRPPSYLLPSSYISSPSHNHGTTHTTTLQWGADGSQTGGPSTGTQVSGPHILSANTMLGAWKEFGLLFLYWSSHRSFH